MFQDMQCKFALLDEIKHLLEPKKILRIFVKTMKLLMTFQLLTAFATLLSENRQCKWFHFQMFANKMVAVLGGNHHFSSCFKSFTPTMNAT
ncbi:hypothetical protein T11_10523 [Trichinella zimbabwensis]|uniref:Uncharacterized protein n=1 Tax=Trichinella zimbabwensis TaxID=268475 RepID=A0A0V1GCP4_9BILA|nr:hypothetical protein T11_10523 [Trichinella zimbabwensis]